MINILQIINQEFGKEALSIFQEILKFKHEDL